MESRSLERAFAHDAPRRPGEPSALSFDRRDAIRVSSEFEASPEEVFDAWLDPEIAGKWLFATAMRPAARVAIDARVGGEFHFVEGYGGGRFNHVGVYLVIDRPRRRVFTLAGEERSREHMQVSVEITQLDPGCVLTLAHQNVPPDRASRVETRWTGMLYGLREILDP